MSQMLGQVFQTLFGTYCLHFLERRPIQQTEASLEHPTKRSEPQSEFQPIPLFNRESSPERPLLLPRKFTEALASSPTAPFLSCPSSISLSSSIRLHHDVGEPQPISCLVPEWTFTSSSPSPRRPRDWGNPLLELSWLRQNLWFPSLD